MRRATISKVWHDRSKIVSTHTCNVEPGFDDKLNHEFQKKTHRDRKAYCALYYPHLNITVTHLATKPVLEFLFK